MSWYFPSCSSCAVSWFRALIHQLGQIKADMSAKGPSLHQACIEDERFLVDLHSRIVRRTLAIFDSRAVSVILVRDRRGRLIVLEDGRVATKTLFR